MAENSRKGTRGEEKILKPSPTSDKKMDAVQKD
jgi:hypothetical protein